MNLILKENINAILFFNFYDEKYSGITCSTKLELKNTPLDSEILLQELFASYLSAPRGTGSESMSYKFYIENRFKEFSKEKKILIQKLSKKLGLKLYDKQISELSIEQF